MKRKLILATKAMTTLILLLTLPTMIFLYTSPQFGGSASKEKKAQYAKTGYYKDGQFINIEEFSLNLDCHSITEMLKKMWNRNENIEPKTDISVLPYSIPDETKDKTLVTWLGHSSFLIEANNKRILLDPIFSQNASPHPWLGVTRYSKKMPFTLDEIDRVDFVLISHDHYDHLDYMSIKKLKEKVSYFLVPLGIENHLTVWGIEPSKIKTFEWWQESQIEDIRFVFTPSKHMSGRGLTDQKATLWGSWVIESQEQKIFFSGDSGYGSHFKTIGEKYGPFDLGLIECGQYDELWPDVHMMPEQAVTAAQDIKAKKILPIHWASFTLANHSWTDPIERVTSAAMKNQLPITTPQIGETVDLKGKKFPVKRWWELYL